MKRLYIVELGTESGTWAIDDPIQWGFNDLDEAIAFYNGLDIRYEWIREYNISHGNSRHNVMAKQILGCIESDGDIVEYGQILQFDEYGEAEYRAEQED